MIDHPSDIAIADYNYHLPSEKIADYPIVKRDESKLLVYKNGQISESVFKKIDAFIEDESVLIFNNTRVIQARLNFKNEKEQAIEIFCLEPHQLNLDAAQAMLTKQSINWKCLVGNLKKWRTQQLTKTINEITLTAELIEKNEEDVTVAFSWEPANLCFAEVIDLMGVTPIPPYLKRKSEEIDAHRYQTIYAQTNGSVAAPTAGLHFTNEVSKKLQYKNCTSLYVTLHVGAGTFKPVKSTTLKEHVMHSEWIEVNRTTISELVKSDKRKKIAVGTTSLRTLESLYWMGLKAYYDPKITLQDLEITQWEPYELVQKEITITTSLTALLAWLTTNNLEKLICKTQILLAPPYQLKLVDGIITNFHQPQSTLLLLISCIVGDNWKNIYQYALNNDFKFLSYGDSSLLLK